jgi:hypothetical protein
MSIFEGNIANYGVYNLVNVLRQNSLEFVSNMFSTSNLFVNTDSYEHVTSAETFSFKEIHQKYYHECH